MERREYQKGLKYHYLVLSPGKEDWQENFEVQMLVNNRINGLLGCEVIRMDGTLEFHYEITNAKSIEKVFENARMGHEQLRGFLLDLLSTLERLSEYMLDGSHLILEPSCIYLNQENGRLLFCCLPFYQGELSEHFHALTEYLMKVIDYRQKDCVMLGTSLHKQSMEVCYDVSEVLTEVFVSEAQIDPGVSKPMLQGEFAYEPEAPEQEQVQTKAEKNINVRGIIGIAGAVIIAAEVIGIIYLKFFRDYNWNQSDLLKATVGTIVVIALLFYFYSRKEEKESVDEWETEASEDSMEYPTEHPEAEEEEYTILLRTEPETGGYLRYVGDENFNDFYITRDTYLVGKKKEIADGVIEDLSVSRVHSKIMKEGDNYYLIDLGSTNGTYLNGRRMPSNEKEKLHKSDRVHFAKVEYIWDEIIG